MDETDRPVTHQELRQELAGVEERLTKTIRGAQTEIIKALMDFQAQNAARNSALETTAASLAERLAIVERRLREVEAKLLLNPPGRAAAIAPPQGRPRSTPPSA